MSCGCCEGPEGLVLDAEANLVREVGGLRVWGHKKPCPDGVAVHELRYIEATGTVTDGVYEWHRLESPSFAACKP